MLEVGDKGRGIPAGKIDHVTRAVRGRQASSGGSGLGLAIVKRIVTDHGGRLAIRSTVGVGTVVSASIPIYEPDEKTDSRR